MTSIIKSKRQLFGGTFSLPIQSSVYGGVLLLGNIGGVGAALVWVYTENGSSVTAVSVLNGTDVSQFVEGTVSNGIMTITLKNGGAVSAIY